MAWRSCSVLFRPTGGDLIRNSAWRGRWPHSFQQRRCFRNVSKKTEPKKMETPGPAHTETPKSAVQHRTPTPMVDPEATISSPRSFGRLVRPFFFTVGFTGCSFGSAAIWQYESLKSQIQSYFSEARADWLEKIRPQKRGDFRK
ncbi:presenilins-associated rhomboid-like protein, mitochondrial, partial [Austrofundulus limnaeus]|uniref:Presenilins-associated rhomboid-like protein, mitochondrial n=1 Tax=Austrofundulus limnaeus TaxID=52670 RepID=A0A2I4D939_AUSLI